MVSGKHNSRGTHWVEPELKAQVRASGLSFLERVFGRESAYYTNFESSTQAQLGSHFKSGLGILRSAQEEIHGGWLFNLRSLVSADIFADYLVASHLSDGGYKDPAAVLAGSTLEEHIRQLCQNNGVPVEENKNGKLVPLRADRLNAELAKAGVYGKLDQKNVTAWLDLRNKAAHGHYGDYTEDQVRLLIQSVGDFIARHPAYVGAGHRGDTSDRPPG